MSRVRRGIAAGLVVSCLGLATVATPQAEARRQPARLKIVFVTPPGVPGKVVLRGPVRRTVVTPPGSTATRYATVVTVKPGTYAVSAARTVLDQTAYDATLSRTSVRAKRGTRPRIVVTYAPAPTPPVQRASLATHPAGPDGVSSAPALSADGRYVAYASDATDIVAGDTNHASDIFEWDRLLGTTVRISVDSSGGQADAGSRAPSISADGRYVAYASDASDLVANDTNEDSDVFVWDRSTGLTRRVSIGDDGAEGDRGSYLPSISADGVTIAFASDARTLVADDTDHTTDVFVRERNAGSTTRVSVATDGSQATGPSYAPALSADGSTVAYFSDASDLVAGDTNVMTDVFVHHLADATTTRVSVATDGGQGDEPSYNPALSADGSVVAFESVATTLVTGDTNGASDVFAWSAAGGTVLVSAGAEGAVTNGPSYAPAVSSSGDFVAFHSAASNLVRGDTNGSWDVFGWDRGTGVDAVLSRGAGTPQQGHDSYDASVDATGRFVAYQSDVTNLVPGDANGVQDIFVRDAFGH